jgi:hypothetical protein
MNPDMHARVVVNTKGIRAMGKRVGIVFAALLGAVIGATVSHQYAKACSCSLPEWELRLNRSTEPDDSIWPPRASIRDGYGSPPLLFLSRGGSDAKIDHLQGGAWGRH